jgi:hypothetical protein
MQSTNATTVARSARRTPALAGASPPSPGCSSPGLEAASVAAANANGSYSWLVSGTGSSNRICVTNTADPGDTDVSDVAFTITP